jgi:Zn-dependent metalloprotease
MAKEYIGAREYIWENEAENNWLKAITNDKTASFYPNPEIVICKNSIDFQDTTFHIAYKIDIYAKEPVSRDDIFVDAKNGRILAVNPILVNVIGTAETRYSGTRSISTQQNGSTYRLRGYDNNRSVETYNMNKGTNYAAATDFTDNDNYWSASEYHNANKDGGALDAHWGTMMTYDYFKNIHGRDSYDNNGAVLRSYVHYSTNYDNAFWDGLRMTYGDGHTRFDILTSLDVAAHEIGHGVCTYTANLVYSGESGAINETYSDIWAACVQNYAAPNKQIWLIGDEIDTPPLRNMSNPHLSSPPQPDTYGGGPNWTGPNAGVHTNSGIMNHWFYILSVGKSGTNGIGNAYNVTGIGISKAEKIAYRALAVYMTSGTSFANARTHTIQAAIDLFGDCTPEVEGVTNAWYAVGVGNLFTGTTTISNTTYSSGTHSIVGCTIEISNTTIEPNTTVKIHGNQSVILKPGFHAKAGSNVTKTAGGQTPPNPSPNYSPPQDDGNTNYPLLLEELSVESPEIIGVDFSIYPNHNNGNFTIKISGQIEPYTVEIFNNFGGLLGYVNCHDGLVNINRTNLNSGIYYVRITMNGKVAVKKVIVQ